MIYAGALESLRGRFDEARALHAGGSEAASTSSAIP